MKTLFFLAAALAVGTQAQAREPENLTALIDEMAVLERVLGAALESETSESARDRSGWRALNDLAGVNLRPWFQESVRTIEAEYLVRQGILVSLELNRRPLVRELPTALFTTLARTGETRLPKLVASLEPEEFAELRRLVDEHDEARKKHSELTVEWRAALEKAHLSGASPGPESSAKGREAAALLAIEREQRTAINAEVERLRSLLVEPAEEASTADTHVALMQAVCDYARLKSLPEDEHLTLKVVQDKAQEERRTGRQWTYYVLAKKDVVECRLGSINAEELRQRAYIYSRERPRS